MIKRTLIVFFGLHMTLFAVPANPEPARVRYPDGTELHAYLRGDEHVSWYESLDGYRLLRDPEGNYEYAFAGNGGQPLGSGIRARDPEWRGLREKDFLAGISRNFVSPVSPEKSGRMQAAAPAVSPFERTDFPTLGEQRFLVIPVEFADLSFTHRPADFDSLMNAEEYTYNNAVGSVAQYYRDASSGRFDPHFDMAGPVRLDSGYAYYGRGDDENIQIFVHEAVTKADPQVDFSQYDNDGDGVVDNIYFIYAGYGECFSGADVNTIWPHRWAYLASTLTVDGKQIYDYSTSMELYGTTGTTRSSIGVICHEFGHVCGLPDFYDTDYDGSGGNCGGLGQWDLMAGGSWNYSGRRPPLFNAWSRMYLQWAEPAELTDRESVTLNPAHSHNEIRYFRSATEDEFFMMENRQQSSWDAALPGPGLMIFHIDMNHGGWNNNTLNCDPYRQGFDLEEADGDGNITAYYTDAGDPFPGTAGTREFTDSGSPNALDWSGRPSRSPLRNIREESGVITFDFGDAQVDPPGYLTAEAAGYDSVLLRWSLNSAGDPVLILMSAKGPVGYPRSYIRYDTGDSLADGEVIYKGRDSLYCSRGLHAGTTYHYGIFAFEDSSCVYSEKRSASATTPSPVYYETAFANGLPEGWISFDRTGNGSWSAENPGERDFRAATADSGFMIIDSEFAGDKRIDAELITRSFNFGLSRSVILRFEHKLRVASLTLARVLYTVNDGLTWYEVKRWTEDTADPETVELDLTAAVAGFRDVKFKFNYRAEGEKYWCIDDLSIRSALREGAAASFYLAERSGPKPFTAKFLNTSASAPGSIDSVIWEFGDGDGFHTGMHPQHTYTHSGDYSVSLTVTKNGVPSYFTREDLVHVTNEAPVYVGNDTLDLRRNTASAFNLQQLFADPNGDPMRFFWETGSTGLNISARSDSVIDIVPADGHLGTEHVTLAAVDNEDDTTAHEVSVWISETGLGDMLPESFTCSGNYPNPFNPATNFRYRLPANCPVSLKIYDVKGTLVRTLVDAYQEAGSYELRFHAAALPSGVYVYRLTAGGNMHTGKMILMK